MSSGNVAGGSGSKRVLVIILAIIGLAAVVIGVLFYFSPSTLPHLFFAHNESRTGHHKARAGVSAAVGIILIVAAALVGRSRRS